MPLPKLTAPRFTIELPSDNKKISFRPFLVKEEKNLLIASESKDIESMISSISDIINSCVLEENFDAMKLCSFDFEYLFLNIRAKSIGEKIKLRYRHRDGKNYKGEDCNEIAEVEIDIDTIKVSVEETHSRKIMINSTLGIQMRYPIVSDMKILQSDTSDIDLIASCIEFVYDGETVYDPDNIDDSKKFLESLNVSSFQKILEFFKTMPALKHKINYTCPRCKQDDEVTLEGVADFF